MCKADAPCQAEAGDGRWSPSVPDLKRFPIGLWLGLAAATIAFGSAAALASARLRWAKHCALFGLLASASSLLMFQTPNTITFLANLAVLGVVGLVISIIVVISATKDAVDEGLSHRIATPVTLGVAALITAVPLAAWSSGLGRWVVAAGASASIGFLGVVVVWVLEAETRKRVRVASVRPVPNPDVENTARLTSAPNAQADKAGDAIDSIEG